MKEDGIYSTEPSCLGSKLKKGNSIVFRVCKREIDIINKNNKVDNDFEVFNYYQILINEN